ncbi:FHA domain-containing protein [Halobacteriovorax sp. JY17]|uniref:FHA domain-containing protein n=1 Tax=Halobacteriovorax sp. JY17 TaxID=2014617 RepID=UPI000C610103|nr:FHA domain-containing protein [Halobacteriovorax sp. JY17]PIK16459.1 MAG: hypothetical protein CES88_06890 [Halobacteriovorax sp. JY17]
MKFYLINLESSDFFEVLDQLSVGRKDNCDLVLRDDLVSGRHCRFHIKEHLLFIEDLNASNPVQINNLQIESNSKVKLRNKDKIKIGSIEFYLSTQLPKNELTYKSLILEKVKIHETFDSDLDFEKNEKHWKDSNAPRPQINRKKPKIHNPSSSNSNPVNSGGDTLEDLQVQVIKLSENMTLLNEKLCKTKKFSGEEIQEKISLYSEKISHYTKKRDEVFAIQNLQEQLLELKNKKKELEFKIRNLDPEK